MNENDSVAEIALPPVKVPAILRDMLDDLKYLELKGEKIRLFTTTDIMREALLKGIRLMMMEKEVYQKMIEVEAKNGAQRIYTSLKERADAQEKALKAREALEQFPQMEENKMREEEESPETEEEEGKEED